MEDQKKDTREQVFKRKPAAVQVSEFFVTLKNKDNDSEQLSMFSISKRTLLSSSRSIPMIYQDGDTLRVLELWLDGTRTWAIYMESDTKATDNRFIKAVHRLASALEEHCNKTIYVETAKKPLVSERNRSTSSQVRASLSL